MRSTAQQNIALRAIGFVLAFAALQGAWQALRGTWVEHLVIHDGTVRPAALLVNLITPHVHASAVGFSVTAAGGGLNILNGCEGTEALFLLFAAFLIAPLPARARLVGVLLGIVVVFSVNQLRIVTLFYAYRDNPQLFELLHGSVTPISVIILVCGYFYAWVIRET